MGGGVMGGGVMGGGVMRGVDRIVQFEQDYVTRFAWTFWGKVQIQVRAASRGNDAALLGAIPMIAELRFAEFEQDVDDVR